MTQSERRALVALTGIAALTLGPLSASDPASAAAGGFCAGGGHVRVITRGTVYGIAAQSNGGFVAFGQADRHNHLKNFVKRFHASGTRDGSFGTRILAGSATGETFVEAMAVDSHNRIVVLGETGIIPDGPPSGNIALWRLLPSGARDTSFGKNGYVRYRDPDPAAIDQAAGLAIDGHDRPVVAGYGGAVGGPAQPLVVRFTTHGRPDKSFNKVSGTGVPYFVPPLPARYTAEKIQVQRDGALVISTIEPGPNPMTLARILPGDLTATGAAALDLSFGTAGNGLAELPQLALDSGFQVQPGGRILVFYHDARHSHPAIARLTRSGVVDTSYGLPGGVPITGVPTTDPNRRYLESVVRLPHGRLAVLGVTELKSGSRAFIARLDPRGALDTQFGNHGLHFLRSQDMGSTMTETPDGHLLVAHQRSFNGEDEGLVYRFHRNLDRAACS